MGLSVLIQFIIKNITGGKRPPSYKDLREFNSNFEPIHNP